MFPFMVYGGDYNPEQWTPDVWQEDARLMQEAKVNLVSLGVFAWVKHEPSPGKYDFAWLDQVMDLLHAHGVRVNLATATASPPPWLVRLHPEILPVTADGIPLGHGSRRHYCPHSPAYRESAARLVTRLAEHVRGHPALVLWHVDNEYACHNSECFCETSVAAFREWLHKRYGSLEELNAAWGAMFWGQHYLDWEEVGAPRRAPASVNPGHRLDWKRFCSDSWLACFEDQKSILKAITPDIPVTTNFMSFFKPLDYWEWAAHEDIVSNDSYPDPGDPQWMVTSGMMCDLMRSLGNGRPWLLMEQAPSNVNWRQRNGPKRPGQMRLGSYQALARGGNGIMFFQWRASRAGSEKFHSGMVPHAGTDSRVWGEVKALGGELRQMEALLPSRVQSEAAILFDWNSWWAMEQGDMPSNELKLLPQVTAIYAELFHRNITVDFVHPKANLAPYRLILAPQLYLLSEAEGENIKRYVADGGTLLMTFFSGIVDEHDRVLLGGYPAAFRELLGLKVEEFVVYTETQGNHVDAGGGHSFPCSTWCDVIRPEGADVLASFQQDYFAGSPAITRNRHGRGTGYYLGTQLDSAGLGWLIESVCKQAGLQGVAEARGGIEMTRRSDGSRTWLFVLNHSGEKKQIRVPEGSFDLVRGKKLKNSLLLAAGDVAVIQFEANGTNSF